VEKEAVDIAERNAPIDHNDFSDKIAPQLSMPIASRIKQRPSGWKAGQTRKCWNLAIGSCI
jgi:hypothetical protein